MLSQHTDVQERVYKEIQEVIGDSDKPLQLKDLDELKYLKAVINETLRLYPPVPFILRYCKDDLKLPTSLILPEGSNVIISIWGIHRNPEHWGEDANDFNPDHFMSGKIPNAFMPFSNGPRNCIGLKYAMLSITTSLVALLRQYHFNPATNFKYDKNNPLRFSFDVMMKHVVLQFKWKIVIKSVIESALSDHKQLYLEIKRSEPERIKRRQYESINYTNLVKSVENIIGNVKKRVIELPLVMNVHVIKTGYLASGTFM
ncbi:probable cytochrome P450 313a1 [Nymphalis io]|uniref:probable cytochrome P450 313a1 n=1 Tax=Inachis io TaxID=171585 RepID=UPI0021699861|nr:probable cytochrome P450 313a1 [Nymphalis io]